ncbi:hypothetical protein FKZ61_000270 [Litorilinea aerophila]|uniref:DUF1795 domain-containing protein n=1 Tax=Litorilinea aerophila TaxID=1204385 RepID=A0A540VM81_9CHLR|nr:hypothetical protein [Litorilinea aerophila]MCC9074549.1 hypothetical protein [Litorilinea aerophila]
MFPSPETRRPIRPWLLALCLLLAMAASCRGNRDAARPAEPSPTPTRTQAATTRPPEPQSPPQPFLNGPDGSYHLPLPEGWSFQPAPIGPQLPLPHSQLDNAGWLIGPEDGATYPLAIARVPSAGLTPETYVGQIQEQLGRTTPEIQPTSTLTYTGPLDRQPVLLLTYPVQSHGMVALQLTVPIGEELLLLTAATPAGQEERLHEVLLQAARAAILPPRP